jgi:hypothetical protein
MKNPVKQVAKWEYHSSVINKPDRKLEELSHFQMQAIQAKM